MSEQNSNVRRGDIYYADLEPTVGSELGGIRPVLILQNNLGNRHSPTLIVAAITSKAGKATLPTHHLLNLSNVLDRDSIVLLEQIRTIDKRRLKECIGAIGQGDMQEVDKALAVSVGLKL